MRHWFDTCSKIPIEHLEALRLRGVRPTIKTILYDKYGNALLYENKRERLALPGGGIDAGELPALGLLRELHEELSNLSLSRKCVEEMVFLHYSQIRTHRDGYVSKGVFLVAGLYHNLSALVPCKSDILRNPRLVKISHATDYIYHHRQTPPKLQGLYAEGFMQLRQYLAV